MAETIKINEEQTFDCNIVNNLMYLTSEDQKRLNLIGVKGKIRLAFLGVVNEETKKTFEPYKKE